jgi:isopenicillin N synthase-like dioxygenase
MQGAVATVAAEMKIPVVDFASFQGDDAAARGATAAQLRRAFEEFGFVYLTNHAVAPAILDGMFEQSRWFFGQPAAAKEPLASREAGTNRGWDPPAAQSLDEGKPFDLKEAYHAGAEDRPPPNKWPAGAPRFREAVLAFHHAAVGTCHQVMTAVALAYGLPADYFGPFFAGERSTTRMLHYPPLTSAPLPGQLRAGAHTDYGACSLLFQDDAGGLEIQHRDGHWLPAPALPGAAIVNTGDLLQRWTNDLIRSSPHRVVPPEGAAAGRARYSAVLFFSPRPDAIIECLAPCQSAERPAKYPPVASGEYIRARSAASRRTGY